MRTATQARIRAVAPAARAWVAATALAVGSHAQAHHSAAMFDTTKCGMITGTVRTFQFQYPHSWVWVNVKNAAGAEEVWGLEAVSPSQLLEIDHRWTREVLKFGDKISAEFMPLRDGRTGGLLQSIRLPDGSIINGWRPVSCPIAKANAERTATAVLAPAEAEKPRK
jgi:hypothetical protein